MDLRGPACSHGVIYMPWVLVQKAHGPAARDRGERRPPAYKDAGGALFKDVCHVFGGAIVLGLGKTSRSCPDRSAGWCAQAEVEWSDAFAPPPPRARSSLAEGGLAPPVSGPFPEGRSQGAAKGYC